MGRFVMEYLGESSSADKVVLSAENDAAGTAYALFKLLQAKF
ncbi:MAG: hypothetical protein OFPII_19280 [Osedax symbiont Rs1]|nr:MAG: hypothetical protein OFPII_19280 [Osedax symbiont Rs1]